MSEQKNLLLAILLVIGILFGFHYLYERPKLQEQDAVVKQSQTTSVQTHEASPHQINARKEEPLDRTTALGADKRVPIKTPRLAGSVNLKGGIIDDLKLLDYHESPDEKGPPITLLSPSSTKEGYLGKTGWTYVNKDDYTRFELPNEGDLWLAEAGSELTPEKPLTLTYTNGKGLIFERTISVDKEYMFKVEDRIVNTSGDALVVKHTSIIERHDVPVSAQSGFILHEGPIGVINSKLVELAYDKLTSTPKPRETFFTNVQRSWIGFTDKYWLTALLPQEGTLSSMSFYGQDSEKRFFTQVEGEAITLKASEEKTQTIHLFAGPKILSLLDHYEKELSVDKFDLAVDFGWFYFLTKPMLHFLQFLHVLLGNFGLAILVLTVIVKALFFPLANKSYRSMSRMRALAPQIEALKARYSDDRMKLNQAMMELYQKEKVNPMSGCLPMLIQAPVFFCLYKVLYVSLDMRHAPFYGWIQDLSAPDPTSIVNLFGLLPFQAPSFLQIGVWPIIMGLTMFIQQKLNPQPADKAQATVFLLMPLFMTFLFASFPAGLVIYWTWSNVLGILQQWIIMRLEAKRVAATPVKRK